MSKSGRRVYRGGHFTRFTFQCDAWVTFRSFSVLFFRRRNDKACVA